MKNKEKVSVFAKIIEKKDYDYFAMPGKVPTPEGLYEVYFETEKGDILHFAVDYFCFNVLEIGDEGILEYHGVEIISFSDKLKEFHL